MEDTTLGRSVGASPPPQEARFNRNSERIADDLVTWLRRYASTRINSQLIDERRCIPPHVVLDFGNRGLLAMLVDESFGGLGLTHRDSRRVIEQLAAIDLTLAIFVGLNNTLGLRPITRFGSNALKAEILPDLARGRALAAFALTEEGAGSNPRAIAATARPSSSGEWTLSGRKIWSGSSAWANVITVFVRATSCADELSGRMTAFALRQGVHDVRLGPEALTMGVRGMVQNSIILDGTRVSRDDLVGEIGQGWDVAEDSMMYARLGLGAISVGGMKRCLQLMHRYALRRSVASGRLLNNGVTLARLSDIANATIALDSLLNFAARMLDAGETVEGEVLIACKVAGSEFLWQAADRLVQLLGGRGYIETNLAPQILRDARLLRIFEGPTETLTAFLGSKVLNDFGALERFLARTSGATTIGGALRSLAENLKRSSSKQFLDRGQAIRRNQLAAFALGEVAIAAILCAGAELCDGSTPEAVRRQCRNWAKARLDGAVASAPELIDRFSGSSTTDHIGRLVKDFAASIGDIARGEPGCDVDLDPLLRFDPDGAD